MIVVNPLKNHFVMTNSFEPPFPKTTDIAIFGMGCFWGPERLFWETSGVHTTAVGYAGGETVNPTYEDVCKDTTGHVEVVMIIFDSHVLDYQALLKIFWESHNPTHGMRQRSDVGSQYRSAIYANSDEQMILAKSSLERYQEQLSDEENNKETLLSSKILGAITTEIKMLDKFYYAEEYHQQYLAKNPNGYCSMKGTGVSCSI